MPSARDIGQERGNQEYNELIQELINLSIRQQEIAQRLRDLRPANPQRPPVAVSVAQQVQADYETGDGEEELTPRSNETSHAGASIASSSVEVVGVIRRVEREKQREPSEYTSAELTALQSGCTLWTSATTGKRYIIHPSRRSFAIGDIVKTSNPANPGNDLAPSRRDGTGVITKVHTVQVSLRTDSGQEIRRSRNNVRYLSAERDEQYAQFEPVEPGRRPNYAKYRA